MGFGNLGIASAKKAAEAAKKAAASAAKKATKVTAKKPRNWKKILQAGALITEAGSRGSSGGIASALQESEIDLSGRGGGMGKTVSPSGASNGAVDTGSFDEQNTEDAAGKGTKNNYSE
tara:strand:+ start:209 stop:565 length:357 start_codon:yes stop_codon:yes gene_type:complete